MAISRAALLTGRSGSGANLRGWENRFLPEYANSLKTDRERAAYQQAVKTVRGTQQQGRVGGSLAGGGDWADFTDYHNVRRQTENLLGRKYSVSGAGESGEMNTRTETGPSTVAQEYARVQQAPPRAASAGGRMAGGDSESLVVGGASERDALALRMLRAAVEQQERGGLRDIYGAMDENQFGPGTVGGERRVSRLADLKRQIGFQDALAGDEAKSSAYWRYGEPIERHKASERERQQTSEFGRESELARIKGEAATLDDVIRAQASGGRDASNQSIAQLRALMAGESNARQYGDTGRMEQLGGAFNQRAGIGQPPDIQPQGEGDTVTDTQTGMRWTWRGGQWHMLGAGTSGVR